MGERSTRPAFLTVALALILTPLCVVAESEGAKEEALYKRLGGYDVIATTVDNFLERYDADPELIPFLGGINTSESLRIRQHFVDYLCATTGGPCYYLGRDMVKTHEGLAINDAQYDRVMDHLESAMDHAGIGKPEKRELLTMLAALRPEIVGQ